MTWYDPDWAIRFRQWLGLKLTRPPMTSGATSVLFVLRPNKPMSLAEIQEQTRILPADLDHVLDMLEKEGRISVEAVTRQGHYTLLYTRVRKKRT